MGLYIYGVVRWDGPTEVLRSVGVDSVGRVEFLPQGQVAAAFSFVRLQDFSEDRVRELLRSGDTRWMEEKVLLHATVLQELMQRGPVIPMRFGILFRNQERVCEILKAQENESKALLAHVEGKVEWGVKVFVDEQALREAVLKEDPDAAALQRRLKTASPGVAYLHKKKLDLVVEERASEFLPLWAGEIHTTLAEVSREAVPLGLPDLGRGEQSPAMALHSAYLVSEDETARFRDVLEWLGRVWADRGLRFDLSGPWPPYHFARLSGEGENQ